jgi:predicted metal-dependent phosphoesterase TrpH
MVDLHVHSNKSDGSLTPSQLVNYAVEKKLHAMALTDHDTIDGLDEALSAAAGKPLEVIPGIEFSTEYEKKDIHIVGLYIEYHQSGFHEQLQHFVDSRISRNKKMCDALQAGAGMDITYEKLLEEFPGAVITRSHYARYMFAHGYIKSLPEAFDRYIGDHSKYFIPREKVTPEQAIQLILSVGGIPVLAHPILYRMSDSRLDALVSRLADAGLIGIEAIYSTYEPREERQVRQLAAKYNLCISGGSDFHGACKPGLDLGSGYGRLAVPDDVLYILKQKLPGSAR